MSKDASTKHEDLNILHDSEDSSVSVDGSADGLVEPGMFILAVRTASLMRWRRVKMSLNLGR